MPPVPQHQTFALTTLAQVVFTPAALCIVAITLMSSSLLADQDKSHARQLNILKLIFALLHTKCVKCHGENQQKGDLRLDSLETLLKGGESGPAAVAGKPGESLLLEAVRYESFEMPPDKPLAPKEIAYLEQWIADGAAWPQLDGTSVRLSGTTFLPEELNFWSLQPLTQATPPTGSIHGGNNSVDRFIAAKLDAANVQPAPKAEDDVLVRRLYFDLLGVPPSPQDFSDFASGIAKDRSEETNSNSAADAESFARQYSALVETLLDDPRYGEHWGRYWLDIVRYAESDGFRADFYRPDAWRYRDYVVNAFNDDKPYDQFVTEQLAGDEVAPNSAEALVATGYLRTYLYEYNQRDARTQWQDILNQVTDVTGEVFLGLGVGCARCHDHKFDPILQEDYYRLQACFGTMTPRDDIPAADLADRQQYSQQYEAWLAKSADLRSQLENIRGPYRQRTAKGAIERFPEDIQLIMAKPISERTSLDAQLADLVDRQIVFDQERQKIKDEDKKRIDELEKEIAEISGKEPSKLPAAMTVSDLSTTPQPIHLAANPNRKPVLAGGFSILDPSPFALHPANNSTGQRTALANWITSQDNPLTARVIVNRIWQHHFGTGLVTTASDFGSLGGRPTHPELLDWLATEFMANGWSIKWLHRQILNSATWQMSAFHPNTEHAEKVDPANALRWRFDVGRLNAEQVRDAMLVASGELLSEQGGPSAEHTSLRRSLYLKVLRNQPEALLKSLDGVDGLNSIPKRSTTTTPTQALNLMNGEWVRTRSAAMAKRVLEESSDTDLTAIAETAFRVAIGRGIESAEIPVAVQLMNDAMQSEGIHELEQFGSLVESAGTSLRVGDKSPPPLATSGNAPAIKAPFTTIAIFKLDSLYADATVRTIISQWDSNNSNRGWAIGITSEKSAYKPRNLILQVVGDEGYEVVASNLRPDLDQTYVLAVSVEQSDGGKARADFYLKPLNTEYGKPAFAQVEFKTTAGITGLVPVALGGRTKQSRQRWDGQLDQVAIFDKVLSAKSVEELFAAQLNTDIVAAESPIAFWTFDNADQPLADTTSHQHQLNSTDGPSLNPLEQAVAELCQVLLNSNEFVYID